jgi:uncharacterized membrane protein YebE (DUF533 family)
MPNRMFDADKIIAALQGQSETVLERLRTDPAARQAAIAGAGGLAAGLLAGRASPRFAGAALKLGGVAALGGLAYYAWRRHQARQSGQGVSAPGEVDAPPAGFLPPPDTPQAEVNAKLTLQAMINAAKADGRIDSEERARLFDRLGAVHLTDEEQNFLFAELARPIDTDGLVAAVGENAAVASQVYAASLLAIDADQPSEQAYLAELAARLRLPQGLIQELHAAAR